MRVFQWNSKRSGGWIVHYLEEDMFPLRCGYANPRVIWYWKDMSQKKKTLVIIGQWWIDCKDEEDRRNADTSSYRVGRCTTTIAWSVGTSTPRSFQVSQSLVDKPEWPDLTFDSDFGWTTVRVQHPPAIYIYIAFPSVNGQPRRLEVEIGWT